MLDSYEKCFFPNELDPLISGKILPKPETIKIDGKWIKNYNQKLFSPNNLRLEKMAPQKVSSSKIMKNEKQA